MSLQRQVAMVTGGAGYIGSTTARRLAGDGATVIACDLAAERAQAVAADIVAEGGQASGIALDVCSPAGIESVVAQIIERHGRLDILVNAAGGSARERASNVHGSRAEVVDEVLDINLRGMIHCCRAVIGQMLAQGRGRIVSVASVVGMQGLAGHADYAAAKAGVIAYSKSLAMEVGRHGINVNCVSPGLVPRPGTATEHVAATNYLGRVASAETVANVIAFLVSEQAEFVLGQNYVVDGGRCLGLHGSP